jgi:hypothetical protein
LNRVSYAGNIWKESSLPHGNVSDDQFLLVARTFTPNGLSLLATSTPMAPNPRIKTYIVHYNTNYYMNISQKKITI